MGVCGPKNTLNGAAMTCRCFEYGRYTRKPRRSTAWSHQATWKIASTAPRGSPARTSASALPANCQWSLGAGARRIRPASAARSVTMRPRIRSRMNSPSMDSVRRRGLVTSRRNIAYAIAAMTPRLKRVLKDQVGGGVRKEREVERLRHPLAEELDRAERQDAEAPEDRGMHEPGPEIPAQEPRLAQDVHDDGTQARGHVVPSGGRLSDQHEADEEGRPAREEGDGHDDQRVERDPAGEDPIPLVRGRHLAKPPFAADGWAS